MKRRSEDAHPRGAVEQYLRELDHPLKPAIELLRSAILDASPQIAEGVKWNSPSFFLKSTGAYFATINVHRRGTAEDGLLVILHLGAKVRDTRAAGLTIRDPDQLLKWLAKDRCAARFRDLDEVKAKRPALQDIVRQWIVHAGG